MISRQPWIGPCVIVAALLGVWTEVARGEISIEMTPQHPEIGGSVTFSVTGLPGTIRHFLWYKGPEQTPEYYILTYFPGTNPPLIRGPLLQDRMEAFPTGSLKISNLNRTDEGNYIVRVSTDNGDVDAYVNLKVYEKVGKPQIEVNTSQPKELDTVTFTCISTNAETIVWGRISARLPSGSHISPDNKTLTLPRINRKDSGEYQCVGENPISKSTSVPYKLSVSYGPENLEIQLNTLENSFISLKCSADSVPTPNFRWRFNGEDLNVAQNSHSVDIMKPENKGTYECVATNTVTQKTANTSIYVNETKEPLQNPAPLGLGTIIGIVIAVLLLMVLAAALVYLFVIHKRRKKLKANSLRLPTKGGNSTNGQVNAAPPTEEPEVQYADIFIKNIPRKEKHPPEPLYGNRHPPTHPPPETVVYSELKIK